MPLVHFNVLKRLWTRGRTPCPLQRVKVLGQGIVLRVQFDTPKQIKKLGRGTSLSSFFNLSSNFSFLCPVSQPLIKFSIPLSSFSTSQQIFHSLIQLSINLPRFPSPYPLSVPLSTFRPLIHFPSPYPVFNPLIQFFITLFSFHHLVHFPSTYPVVKYRTNIILLLGPVIIQPALREHEMAFRYTNVFLHSVFMINLCHLSQTLSILGFTKKSRTRFLPGYTNYHW